MGADDGDDGDDGDGGDGDDAHGNSDEIVFENSQKSDPMNEEVRERE